MKYKYSVRVILFLSFTISLAFGCNPASKKPDSAPVDRTQEFVARYDSGKTIFSAYCRSCHLPPETINGHNYAFHNLFDRLPQPAEKYLIDFLKDSKALRESGDKYVLELDTLWPGNSYEHQFADSLTTGQLNDLFIYIKVGVRLNSNSK